MTSGAVSVDRLLAEDMDRFELDPYGFVRYAFPWGQGSLAEFDGPDVWATTVLCRIRDQLQGGCVERGEVIREAVASGHGIGKSALMAWLVLWTLSTREDSLGVITANTEQQLRTKTWPQVAKWYHLCITRRWFTLTDTSIEHKTEQHKKTWRFDRVTWSEHNTEAFAGLHNLGKRITVLFDEASKIADKVWEVTEGALTDKNTQILWVAFGNPTRTIGRFKDCFGRFRHRWHAISVDSREVKISNKKQIAQWEQDYGEDSDWFKVRVRGMFPVQSAKQFISVTDVDAAFGKHLRTTEYEWAPKIISVDPAWTGDDDFVIGMRQGLMFKILAVVPFNDDDVHMANVIAQHEDREKADAVFIDLGYGTGIVSVGRNLGRNWLLVGFADASTDPGCLNKRAEMYKSARDWLKAGGAIPKDDILYREMTAVETKGRLDGKLQIQSKDEVKDPDNLGWSPNRLDCLVISFAYPVAARFEYGVGSALTSREHTQTDYDPFAALRGRD